MAKMYKWLTGIILLLTICCALWVTHERNYLVQESVNDLTRDHLTRVVQNSDLECDHIVFINRRARDVQVGCDYMGGYRRYLVYRDDYGFNKAKPD